MNSGSLRQALVLAVVVGTIAMFAATASATPVGLLRLDSGAGVATVGINFIDWTPPAGPPNGAFLVGGGSTLTSAVGNPAVGSTGFLLDLGPAPLPIAGFITFQGVPGLFLDLQGIGPGSANTNCTGLAIGGSCSIFIGSPLILTLNSGGTGVALSANGLARDGVGPNSTWNGSFTTQIAGVTPSQIQTLFGCPPSSLPGACTNPTATVSSTYSGEFLSTLTAVPEPASIGLLGIGLIGIGLFRRKAC